MSPTEWLAKRQPSFALLSKAERDAIADFTLLWGLFEGSHLGGRASPGSIQRYAHRLYESGSLRVEVYEDVGKYFRRRYYECAEAEYHFSMLRFGSDVLANSVRDVLAERDVAPTSVLAAVMQIIYRLRNNLFHGEKWSYGLAGQRENFERSNRLLMAVMDADTFH